MMHTSFLSLGSNKGNKLENLLIAKELINKNIGNILLESSVFESEPWGYIDIENYLNMAIKVYTRLEIQTLLKQCLSIESIIGRKRNKPGFEARIIDIDILFYDDLVLDSENIIIPHPRLHLRKFVLCPMDEIETNLMHPKLNKNIHELLLECIDTGKIKKSFT
jgi:2-amino-4-hydroxy-6-hydroxymethyldihydropteridine diphosphokinase